MDGQYFVHYGQVISPRMDSGQCVHYGLITTMDGQVFGQAVDSTKLEHSNVFDLNRCLLWTCDC